MIAFAFVRTPSDGRFVTKEAVMLFYKMRNWRGAVALGLTLGFFLQTLLTPALAAGGWNKIVLIDVSEKSPLSAKAMSAKMRKLLPDVRNILPQEMVEELLGQGSHAKSPELIQAIRLVDESLEKYYAYESESDETLLRLMAATDFIKLARLPSRQTSQLLISAVVMASWLEFKQGEFEAACERLKKIVTIAAKGELNFDYYPSNFRKFTSKIAENIPEQDLAKLTVDSVPLAVNVYVDNVYAGVTPLSLPLKAGEYDIGWESAGRETVVKKVKLAAGREQKLGAKLSWSKGPRGLDWIAAGWHKKMGASQIALAARVAELTQADVAVFVDLVKVRGGYVAAAKIYNARFSQLVGTVHSERIVDFETENAFEGLAKKIAPYLKSKDITYWTKGVDRSVIIDHRVASRGKKPLYKKPEFWLAVGGVVVTGVTVGILAAQDQDQAAATGGVVLGF